jgi:hypothetical protein
MSLVDAFSFLLTDLALFCLILALLSVGLLSCAKDGIEKSIIATNTNHVYMDVNEWAL